MAARRFFVGGNWKMNGNKASYTELMSSWNTAEVSKDVDVAIGVPAPYIDFVRGIMRKDFAVAAQNIHNQKSGAFTGEISAEMVADCGADYVIIGHSERRAIFGETNAQVGAKSEFVVANGLQVIACVGETDEERENGKTMDVVNAQMKAIADNIKDWSKVVIAYEPVWAIGTGKTASPEQAQEVHKSIREWLASEVASSVAATTRILYGGSVKPTNAVELAKCEDIDGFLVGGASLKPDFIEVINADATARK